VIILVFSILYMHEIWDSNLFTTVLNKKTLHNFKTDILTFNAETVLLKIIVFIDNEMACGLESRSPVAY